LSARVVHVLVRGDVQGVGFRAWVRHHAELNGLAGWVRNRRDGTVEAVFSGPDDLVEAMLAACRHGPAAARVSEVEVLPEAEFHEGNLKPGAFDVLRTS
jgi:acylphosphatase